MKAVLILVPALVAAGLWEVEILRHHRTETKRIELEDRALRAEMERDNLQKTCDLYRHAYEDDEKLLREWESRSVRREPCECQSLKKRPGSNVMPLHWVMVKAYQADDDGRRIYELSSMNAVPDKPPLDPEELLAAAEHIRRSVSPPVQDARRSGVIYLGQEK